jgi:NADH pyrophosphatase NudC (nudix superfamily)
MPETYFCREIFLLNLDIMKKCLDLVEFKLGKDSKDFKFCKKEIMNFTFSTLRKFYDDLVKKEIITKCGCKANLRQGYSNCKFCGGCGYIDK